MVTLDFFLFSERGIPVLSVKFMFGLGLYYTRGCSCRVQYLTGVQVRYLSLNYCLLLRYGKNPLVPTSFVGGTPVSYTHLTLPTNREV